MVRIWIAQVHQQDTRLDSSKLLSFLYIIAGVEGKTVLLRKKHPVNILRNVYR